jgi:DNA-binding winged helix-turn-helix (wHTH) protein
MPVQTIGRGSAPGAFDLEGWTVEPQLNRISSADDSVHLEPKAMTVLVCLAEHAGDVVSRQALVDRVWSTEFIADTTLTHTIADLRKAFGDNPRSPRFIETIPKRGYRLVAEVTWERSGGPAASSSSQAQLPPLAVIAGEAVKLSGSPMMEPSEYVLILGDCEIPLSDLTVTLGRGKDTDIQILASEVSRRHARLTIGSNGVAIEDFGSKNGTLVNGEPIKGELDLASGDTIGVGPTTLILRSLVDDPTRTQEDDG